MNFTIDIDLGDVVTEWRGKGVQAVNAALAKAVRVAVTEGAAESRNHRIYQDRTAQLTASIHGDEFFVITPDGAEGQITVGESYASYVNDWERRQSGGDHGFIDLGEAKAEETLQRELEAIDLVI